MAFRDFLTLDRPMAPRLLRMLYGFALLLIVLGLVSGVTGGVRMMMHVPMSRPGDVAPLNPGAATPPGVDDGQMRRHFGMHRRHHFGLLGTMRHQPPAVIGGARILLALLRAAILLLLVRVLAEMAGAVPAMPRRAEP